MYPAVKVRIVLLATLLLLTAGCMRMPIPTSAPPGAASPAGSPSPAGVASPAGIASPGAAAAPTGAATALPAPSLTAVSTPAANPSAPTAASGGAATPPASVTTSSASTRGDAANGAKLFAQLPCSSCHDVTKPFPGGVVGPNLGNIATEAERIVKSPDYLGKAQDAAGYVRESIVDPNAYIVPGDVFHTEDGQSVMPKDFGTSLTPPQIDDLIAYLLTLK